MIPDVVILTEGTGDAHKGALGIYRGQRGRMQIEVTVTGRSCHGSMPWEGLNPLEYGGAIIAEAARRYDERDGFLDDPFLGHGTRTASWSRLETPSDCAVPDRFTFRFDRRLTVGEVPEQARADVEALDAVRVRPRSRADSRRSRCPVYDGVTWRGYAPGNPQIYMGWATPAEHDAIETAVDGLRVRRLASRRRPRRATTGACVPRPGSTGGSSPPTVSAIRFPPTDTSIDGACDQTMGRGGRLQASRDARLRCRDRTEHPQDRRVRRPAGAAPGDRVPGQVPSGLRRALLSNRHDRRPDAPPTPSVSVHPQDEPESETEPQRHVETAVVTSAMGLRAAGIIQVRDTPPRRCCHPDRARKRRSSWGGTPATSAAGGAHRRRGLQRRRRTHAPSHGPPP